MRLQDELQRREDELRRKEELFRQQQRELQRHRQEDMYLQVGLFVFCDFCIYLQFLQLFCLLTTVEIDIMYGQGIGKINLPLEGFIISGFFFLFFTITGAKNMVS